MGSLDLLLICSLSFLCVFLVLSVLAVIIRIITELFPFKESKVDSAIVAAISTSVSLNYPGTVVTKIEELK